MNEKFEVIERLVPLFDEFTIDELIQLAEWILAPTVHVFEAEPEYDLTTVEGLDSLPVGTRLLDRDEDHWSHEEDGWHFRRSGLSEPTEFMIEWGPFTLVKESIND